MSSVFVCVCSSPSMVALMGTPPAVITLLLTNPYLATTAKTLAFYPARRRMFSFRNNKVKLFPHACTWRVRCTGGMKNDCVNGMYAERHADRVRALTAHILQSGSSTLDSIITVHAIFVRFLFCLLGWPLFCSSGLQHGVCINLSSHPLACKRIHNL